MARNTVLADWKAFPIVILAGWFGQWGWAAGAPGSPPSRSPQANVEGNAPTTRPLPPLAVGLRRVAVKFDNGHDTDHRDRGRPVVLIAAGLKVPTDVFRKTFSHVHPAGPGSGGPTDAEARQNKAALMAGLSPYGVTDDRLNTVSNYYRYMKRNHDDLWQHRDAIAYAVLKANNKVVRVEVADPGAGYTTPPTVTIDILPDLNLTATLAFGTDLATNGSIKSIVVAPPATAPTR